MLPTTRALLTHPISRPSLKFAERYHLRDVRAIVLHWTANTRKGANASANRDYFNLGSRPASAHFIVDDRTVIQCLPEYEVGYHCGDRPQGKYKPAGLALLNGFVGLTPNYFTIGVEMCVNADGDWKTTRKNTVDLLAFLLAKHGLPLTALLRHFDVTGKLCPQMFILQPQWEELRIEVATALIAYSARERARVTCKGLNVRAGAGASHTVLGELKQGEPVLILERSGEWCRIEAAGWVNGRYLQTVLA